MQSHTAGKSRLVNSGTGPGEQTLDGCSVDFYTLLPADDIELKSITSGIEPPATLLELGCGTGRLTHALLAKGYTISSVDNSADMLAHVKGAETIHSDIESLQLNQTFDGVLLASRLLNCPDKTVRHGMLACARRHLESGGILLAEVHSARILDMKTNDHGEGEHYAARIPHCRVVGSMVEATIEYQIGENHWTQSFKTEYLTPDQLRTDLENNSLRFVEWIDEEQTWMKIVAE